MIVAIIALFLLSSLLVGIEKQVSVWQFTEEGGGGLLSSLFFFLRDSVWPIIKLALAVGGALAAGGLAYSLIKLTAINKIENAIFKPKVVPIGALVGGVKEEAKNARWEKVVELSNSSNPSDWRLAIIEADVMLEERLSAMGLLGDSVGDMLKSVGEGDMVTLDAAWEAHKVRNRIAHSGSEFDLNERETRRTISLFEAVLKELKVI